jgi:DNA-binding transcriptional regulator of glucitol operon
LAGDWAVTIKYLHGQGEQQFSLQQAGGVLTGTHKGEIYQGMMTGTVRANTLEIRSHMPVSGSSIEWRFKGMASGNALSGSVDMGEYGPATWTATRL